MFPTRERIDSSESREDLRPDLDGSLSQQWYLNTGEVETVGVSRRRPWTANPRTIIGGLLTAFLFGMGVVFGLARVMLPSPASLQPVPVVAVAPPVPVQASQPLVAVQAAPPEPGPLPSARTRKHPAAAARHRVVPARRHASKPKDHEQPGWVDPFAQ